MECVVRDGMKRNTMYVIASKILHESVPSLEPRRASATPIHRHRNRASVSQSVSQSVDRSIDRVVVVENARRRNEKNEQGFVATLSRARAVPTRAVSSRARVRRRRRTRRNVIHRARSQRIIACAAHRDVDRRQNDVDRRRRGSAFNVPRA